MMQRKLEGCFERYYRFCYRVAFTMVKNHADAEDIAQEAMLRLLIYQPEFAGTEHEKAWMARTTVNLCKDLFKSKWHRDTVGMDAMMQGEKLCALPSFPEDDETLQAVRKLPRRYRDCLYLFYYEDYSVREIAMILDEPENTVKTNLRRGREALKQRLKERS